MIVKLLTEHHLECLSLKGGCRGSSESTHVKCHNVENHTHWLNFNIDVFVEDGYIRLFLFYLFSVCYMYMNLLANFV